PVPGMDRVRGGLAGSGEHVLDREIALPRRRGSDADRLVAGAHVEGGAVRVAVDGDGANAHLAAGPGDADGDLAAIGDEDLADGHASFLPRGAKLIPRTSRRPARRRHPSPRLLRGARRGARVPRRARSPPDPPARLLALLHSCLATPLPTR